MSNSDGFRQADGRVASIQEALKPYLKHIGMTEREIGIRKNGTGDDRLGPGMAKALERLVLMAQVLKGGVAIQDAKRGFNEENLTNIGKLLLQLKNKGKPAEDNSPEVIDIAIIRTNIASLMNDRDEKGDKNPRSLSTFDQAYGGLKRQTSVATLKKLIAKAKADYTADNTQTSAHSPSGASSASSPTTIQKTFESKATQASPKIEDMSVAQYLALHQKNSNKHDSKNPLMEGYVEAVSALVGIRDGFESIDPAKIKLLVLASFEKDDSKKKQEISRITNIKDANKIDNILKIIEKEKARPVRIELYPVNEAPKPQSTEKKAKLTKNFNKNTTAAIAETSTIWDLAKGIKELKTLESKSPKPTAVTRP